MGKKMHEMPHVAETRVVIFVLLCCQALCEVVLSANKAKMKERLINKIEAAEETLMQWVIILFRASYIFM